MWHRKANHMIIIGIDSEDCLIIEKEEIVVSLIDLLKNYEFKMKFERNI
jgi:hypothetical protein